MLKSISLATITITLLLSIQLTVALKYESTRLDLGSEHIDSTKGSETKFFTVSIDSNLADDDLLIDSKIINGKNDFNESPILLISTSALPNNDKTSKWVCNQLGSEACFITNRHIKETKEVYIAVYCESCDFSIKASYNKDLLLKDGESSLFHLKSGDSKEFQLDSSFSSEKNSIQISSFNLKMSTYQMNVRIQDKENSQNSIEVPVKTNWIGGQQAMFKPSSDSIDSSKFDYFVTIQASSDGIFNLEAKTSKAVIPLKDRSIKFENLMQNQKLCFSYEIDTKNAGSDLDINAKSFRGNITFKVYPEASEINALIINLDNGKELSQKVTADFRNSSNASSGIWMICAQSNDNEAYFTLNVHLDQNSKLVNEYKMLLFKLLKHDDMYMIDYVSNKNSNKIENAPVFRLLQNEVDSGNITTTANSSTDNTTQPSTTNLSENTDHSGSSTSTQSADTILINGMGVAGIGVSFLFIIPVMIGCFAMMGIFVNTKFIDQPIKIKITE